MSPPGIPVVKALPFGGIGSTPHKTIADNGSSLDHDALGRLDHFIEAEGGHLGKALKVAKSRVKECDEGLMPRAESRSSNASSTLQTAASLLRQHTPQKVNVDIHQSPLQPSTPGSSQPSETAPLLGVQTIPFGRKDREEALSGLSPTREGLEGLAECDGGEDEDDDEFVQIFLGTVNADEGQEDRSLPKSSIKAGRKPQEQIEDSRFPPTLHPGQTLTGGSSSSSSRGLSAEMLAKESGKLPLHKTSEYMKAMSDPYVKALAIHREELLASQVNLEKEHVDSLAARLSTQRFDALATLRLPPECERENTISLQPSPRMEFMDRHNQWYCATDYSDTICGNNAKGGRSDLLVMVPYHAHDADGHSAASGASGSTTLAGTGSSSSVLSETDRFVQASLGKPVSSAPPAPSRSFFTWFGGQRAGLPELLSLLLVGADPDSEPQNHTQDPVCRFKETRL